MLSEIKFSITISGSDVLHSHSTFHLHLTLTVTSLFTMWYKNFLSKSYKNVKYVTGNYFCFGSRECIKLM